MKVKNISVSAVVIFGQVLAPQQIGEAPDNHGGVQDLIDLGVLQVVADEPAASDETASATPSATSDADTTESSSRRRK